MGPQLPEEGLAQGKHWSVYEWMIAIKEGLAWEWDRKEYQLELSPQNRGQCICVPSPGSVALLPQFCVRELLFHPPPTRREWRVAEASVWTRLGSSSLDSS